MSKHQCNLDANQNPDLKILMSVMDSFLIIRSGEQTSLLVFVDLFATLDADSDHERLLKEMARLHSEYIKMI